MAHFKRSTLPLRHAHLTANQTELTDEDNDSSDDGLAAPITGKSDDGSPILVHRFRHDKSILALAITSEVIYAGTQGGEILVS